MFTLRDILNGGVKMKTAYEIQELIAESCFDRELNECQKVGFASLGVCCDMHIIADRMLMRGEY